MWSCSNCHLVLLSILHVLIFSQDNESSIYCWRCNNNNNNTTQNCEFYRFLTSFKSSSSIHNAPILMVMGTASLVTHFLTFLVKGIGHILQGRKAKVKWRFFGPLKMKGLRWFEMWGTKHLVQQRHVQRNWQLFLSRCDIKNFYTKKNT